MSAQQVYFHVGRFGHPFFDEQLRAAPEGFQYESGDAQAAASGGPRRIALSGSRLRAVRAGLERVGLRVLSHAGHVRRTTLTPPPDCALIHSAQQLLRGPPVPYVVDFECVEVFTLYQRVALARPRARRILLDALCQDSCRALLPWSQAAERGLRSVFGDSAAESLAHKTTTVLPAIRPRASAPAQRKPGPLRVLFVGTAFVAKGGVEAVRAVARARATHEVTLDIVSDVPAQWRAEVDDAEGVELHAWPATHERVLALFQRSDVLLFPSHMDTLGFVMLEAMSHGVPVLATRHFAVPELVEDGVSGLLLEGESTLYGEDGLCRFNHTLPPPRAFRRSLAAPSQAYVERLAGALARVCEDRGLHERLAAGALARVTDGPLSMAARRAALADVYRSALAS
ncbi:MAG TPA: glycosyltransferase family 4 protein [Solirubrobacteraceae bacterium]|jgi:glycosyltransferase involved in cell wall biosynthesis